MENRRDKFVMQKGGIEVIKQGVPYVLKKNMKKEDDLIDNEKSRIVDVNDDTFIDDRELEIKFELFNGNDVSSNDKKKSKKE